MSFDLRFPSVISQAQKYSVIPRQAGIQKAIGHWLLPVCRPTVLKSHFNKELPGSYFSFAWRADATAGCVLSIVHPF